MALAISDLKRDVAGNKRLHHGKITFDSSYPSGGEALTPANIGLHTIERIVFSEALGFKAEYDYANQKVVVKCPSVVTGAAGAGTLDDFPMSGVGATSASIGLTAGNATTRFGGQQEVADTTNLSTLVVYFEAIGT